MEHIPDIDHESKKLIQTQWDLVCQKKVAIPGIEMQVYWENVACDVYQIDEPIGYAWNVIPLSPNNPLRGIFNY